MAIHTFPLINTTDPANPLPIWTLSFDDATKQLTIDCTTSANIPATPTNGESVLLGLLQDLELGAKNKRYDPDSPLSEPGTFDNPDFTSNTNYQFTERTDNEDDNLVTRREAQTVYAFKFVGWFKATAPTAAQAVNNDD